MARAYFADHLGEMEVSGSFGSGPLSVIPFCHRISITHGATSTAPSTREVAYERQKIDNAATVSRGTLRPVIYLGRKYVASGHFLHPACWLQICFLQQLTALLL